jgi:DNA-binding response OmpR family regulator
MPDYKTENCDHSKARTTSCPTIGCIESDPHQRMRLQKLLGNRHMSLLPLSSIAEFDEASQKINLDAAILTFANGNLNAFQTLVEFRQRHCMPLLMIGNFDDPIDRIVLYEAGCDDIMPLDFHRRKLATRVSVLLRLSMPIPPSHH